eukprot:13278219-Ditylum_brightwellii.AAC.1
MTLNVVTIAGGQVIPLPPPAYIYVQGGTEMVGLITEENFIKQILHWVGFSNDTQKDEIFYHSITTFNDIKIYTKKDISDMATDFAGRTVANVQMNFGMRRTKRLEAFAHWVQDFVQVSKAPSIIGLSQITFNMQLDTALQQPLVQKAMKDQADTKAKESGPGPLDSENKWTDWEA